MSASVTISNTFASQSGPIPLSQLDGNFTQLASAVNSTLNFTNYAADTGSANAFAVTFSSPATVSYAAGLTISFKAANANTGASTINVNSLGTKSIVTPSGAALSSGAIALGQVATVVYDGTNFQLQSASSGGAAAAGSNTQVQYNSSGALAGSANFTFDGTNTTVSGNVTSAALIPSGSTVPVNGMYLSAANTIAFSSNTTSRGTVNSTGNWTINAPTSGTALTITAVGGGTTNGGIVLNGSGNTPTSAVTFSATAMTVDCTKSNVFTTTFTANVTTAPTISNPQDGQTINWFITQDATGSRTMTWPTSFKWPGGTAGTLSTGANAVDLVIATYRSSTGFWYASLLKGFA